MAIIAVAGGTGKLRRAIVEALKNTTSHSANNDLAKELGIPLLLADYRYSNVGSLTNLLESNKIDTVIFAVSVVDDARSNAQLNLIEAAERSSSTNRFIPSEFGMRYTEEHAGFFPPITGKLAAAHKLRSTTSLEYTFVSNGFFLDYFGMPKVKTYLQMPFVFAVDMVNNTAAIPGSGDVPIVFTHTFDVARFVAALVSVPDWPERSIVIGDKKAWNDFVAIAEEVKGVKFNITYDNEEKLKTFQTTELPSHASLYASHASLYASHASLYASHASLYASHASLYAILPKEKLQYLLATFGRWTAAGHFNLPEEESLNRRFWEIQPRTVRDILEQGWKA